MKIIVLIQHCGVCQSHYLKLLSVVFSRHIPCLALKLTTVTVSAFSGGKLAVVFLIQSSVALSLQFLMDLDLDFLGILSLGHFANKKKLLKSKDHITVINISFFKTRLVSLTG